MKRYQYSGFSLTELSVSIVIIGLLLAAVTQGANVLKAAKLKTITSEIAEKQAWVNGFLTVYDQLPGDFSFAANYWAAASTQSGNDNGQIGFLDEGVYEGYRAWEHLSYAQISTDQFSGGPGTPGTNPAVVSVDVPQSVLNNAGYLFDYSAYGLSDTNVLVLGDPQAPSSGLSVNGVISPQDAFKLDAKMDDGTANTGSLRAQNGAASSLPNVCLSGSNYDTSLSGLDCIIAYKISTE